MRLTRLFIIVLISIPNAHANLKKSSSKSNLSFNVSRKKKLMKELKGVQNGGSRRKDSPSVETSPQTDAPFSDLVGAHFIPKRVTDGYKDPILQSIDYRKNCLLKSSTSENKKNKKKKLKDNLKEEIRDERKKNRADKLLQAAGSIVATTDSDVPCAVAKMSHLLHDMSDHVMMSSASSVNTSGFVKCEFMPRSQRKSNTCWVSSSMLCDGVSVCATDECACASSSTTSAEHHVFYCSDGNGCIAMKQVCDGHVDCLDASDECVCDSYLNCEINRNNGFCKQATDIALKCALTNDVNFRQPEANGVQLSGLYQCAVKSLLPYHVSYSKMMIAKDYEYLCKKHCKQLSNHCEKVDWENLRVDSVTGEVSLNYTCAVNTHIALSTEVDVCDGFQDCPNRAEELGCANRFYCDHDMHSIPLSKVCDSVPDCHDLSDECQGCKRNNLADDRLMISNKYISYYMVLLCFFIIILNLRGLYGHGSKLYFEKQRFASKLNSVLCVQLCVYDVIMGIYILMITSKNFQYYGSYCLHDADWRSSVACNLAGVVFTFSSHGSLFTALIMGFYRWYTCEHVLTYFSAKRCVIFFTVTNLAILLSSVITLFPIQLFEDTFVTAVSFEGNPMVTKGTRALIDELIMEYYGTKMDQDAFSWSERLALLSNVTSVPGVFEPRRKFGFFNQSPLCIQNLFSEDNRAGIKLFKLAYVTLLGLIIFLFSISYIWIAVTRCQSAVITADKTQRATTEKTNIKMSKKVALIICSQLLAWIPIIIATILSYCGKAVPQDFYEIAAVILIPVNSVLNPLFHSPKAAFRKLAKKRSLNSQYTLPQQVSSNSLTLRGSSTSESDGKEAGDQQDMKESDVVDLSNVLIGVDFK